MSSNQIHGNQPQLNNRERLTYPVLAEPDPIRTIDDLYRSIQQEIQYYKQEHETIKADLKRLLQSNQIGCSLGNLLPGIDGENNNEESGQFDQEQFKRVSNEVINNLKNQLDLVWQEKNTFESLWKSSQKTIQILELEIGEYRRQLKQPKSIHDLRQQYTAALQLLEQNLLTLRSKLNQRTEENKRLEAVGATERDRFEALERDYTALQSETRQLQATVEETRETESRLTAELERAMKEKADLEALLDQANALARRHMGRENLALIKVQEALQIADTVIEEKNSLLLREEGVREECNFLASTIGQVMEEAARKVELEMNALKVGYESRLGALEKQLEQRKELLEIQQQKTNQAETRAATLEDKFKSMIVTNQSLDADLHAASKLIIEMELKMEAFQKTMAKEREISRTSQSREQELKKLLETNQDLQERWKSEMVALTDELQRKLKALRRENCMLKAENNQLKDQLLKAATEDRELNLNQLQ
ncbi:putative leucine-rich repeat-containing protein DDB_G0290503 [Topomyia yanbarensis]|uniref:putative leucine-rich repeat-containing protein DDB_G0290503 n=1 Tax=Topomyia yanbarensis TaxID=2498891 RepID=UPI00273A9619|nr:putative leucine-rich repeat-containing protein DDB_G0290503 [Topomyia yanbarensis]